MTASPADRFWELVENRLHARKQALRDIPEAAHTGYEDEPITLNEGTPYEEPFAGELVIQWASRLAVDRGMEP